jgi:phosphoserine phosphatase
MSYILTLAAATDDWPLTEKVIGETCARLAAVPGRLTWLSLYKAAAIEIGKPHIAMAATRGFLDERKTDIFITPAANRRKKLLIADMDATIVTGETLDELADCAGLKDEISAITARAMEGKIDFEGALRERVALLKGLEKESLQKTLDETQTSRGAKTMIATMKKHGATCVLVSGGFTFFTEAIARKCGFHFNHGNVLDLSGDVLAGTVSGPIIGKDAKADFLERYRAELSLAPEDTLALGDGANDIPMLKSAGLGLGYRPKDAVKKEIANLIFHNNLTAVLYAQGYKEEEFVKP